MTVCCVAKGIYEEGTPDQCNILTCSGATIISDSTFASAAGGTGPLTTASDCIPLSSRCYTSAGTQDVTIFAGGPYTGNANGEELSGVSKRATAGPLKDAFAVASNGLQAAFTVQSVSSGNFYGCMAQGTVQGTANSPGSTCEIASGCSGLPTPNYFYASDGSTCYAACVASAATAGKSSGVAGSFR